MLIAGFQKLTLLDYPGKIAAIVFTQGCNFACGYCHNPEMIPLLKTQKDTALEPEKILQFLTTRKGLLDGVVITGGEPTVHQDLPEFLKSIKDLDFQVKLDSNGSNPDMLEKIIKNELADFFAMDVKATLSKYKKLVKIEVAENIRKSIRIIKDSGIDYEFRSTILPSTHSEDDIRDIGKLIKGAKNWHLQSFRPTKTLHPSFKKMNPFTSEELHHLQKIARQFAENVEVRQ